MRGTIGTIKINSKLYAYLLHVGYYVNGKWLEVSLSKIIMWKIGCWQHRLYLNMRITKTDSNPFRAIDFFLEKRTSLFSFLWVLRKGLHLNICLLGLRFCKNNLIFISSNDHKGTLSCLLNGHEKGCLTLICIYR